MRKKKNTIIGATALLGTVAAIALSIWYPAVFQRGNPIPYLTAAAKLNASTPFKKVNAGSAAEDIYISRLNGREKFLEYIAKDKNAEFQEQAGSGSLFKSGGGEFWVSSEVYWGKYLVWEVPQQARAGRPCP